MSDRLIHILPEQVASQIAAGEVVERPASAVKELVENSLDAGAHTIAIEVGRGGAALIAVTDDGCGMNREDAILSIRRHATSKIRGAADLEAIRTLGFRGEALASIASVSHLRLSTRAVDDAHGRELVADGGNLMDARECGMASGTRVEVRDLFFNTPARLKFLKTVATEQGAIAESVQRLALANWKIAFRLVADERIVFELPRATSLLERVRQLLGGKLADTMLSFDVRGSGARVHGLATASQESFASQRMLFTFVNGRAVRDKLLARAIAQAYQTLLPRGRHPAVALFVVVRAEDVDVNVHPMKTEVRFRSGGAVFEATYRALRDRLADQTAPHSIGVESNGGSDVAVRATIDTAAAIAPASAPTDSRPLRLVADSAASAPPAAQRALGLGFNRPAPDVASPAPRYAELRVLGQLFAGYIVLEDDAGLMLVDQHAAHERVTFERLRAQLQSGGIRTQAMLVPESVELNPARAANVFGSLAELRAMGFDVEPFGAATLLLKGSPAVFGASGGGRLLSDMIESIGENGLRQTSESAFEELLKQLACHGSVRVGRVLESREIHELLTSLDSTPFNSNCPHGRPVHIRFPRGQIERMFRR
ncbi:MAG: DNA mismatch repair endonuclease MutL [Candidatus Binataceae bacterium]